MNEITLTDGRVVNKSDLQFDDRNYVWTVVGTGEDVTLLVPIRGKRLWSNFDADKYALLVSDKHYRDTHNGTPPPPVGSDSTIVNFVDQLYTNPLDAPIDALNTVAKNTVKSVIFNPFASMTGIIVVAIVVFILFPQLFPVAYRFIRRKL